MSDSTSVDEPLDKAPRLIAPPSRWPRSDEPGLFYSWEGPAWVELMRCRAGLSEGSDTLFDALSEHIETSLSRPSLLGPGECYGEGALLSVCAQASSVDPRRFRKYVPRARERVRKALLALRGAEMVADVIQGASGALLGLAHVRSLVDVRDLARTACDLIARAVPDCLGRPHPVVGIAHGLAGWMLATRVGASVFGRRSFDPLAARLCERLLSVNSTRDSVGWPRAEGLENSEDRGWCNGGPGIALAAQCCFDLAGSSSYEELTLAAEDALDLENDILDMCCGRVGLAHIAFDLFAASNPEQRVRRKARVLRLVEAGKLPRAIPTMALFKGSFGIAYLDVRLSAQVYLPLPVTGAELSI